MAVVMAEVVVVVAVMAVMAAVVAPGQAALRLQPGPRTTLPGCFPLAGPPWVRPTPWP